MSFILTALGKFLALMPRGAAHAVCRGVGFLIAEFPSPRRRAFFANIKRCRPDLDERGVRLFARKSAAYTVEMALFVLASPYISENELKRRVRVSEHLRGELKKREGSRRAALLLCPHFCMMESITLMPAISESKFSETGVFYRPFDNPSLERWIKSTREKYGLKLLSRKDGLFAAADFLKNGGNIALLFDQNSGGSGILTLFMGMLAASTDLGGILADKIDCDVAIFWARRAGFWQSEICGEYLEKGETPEETVFCANKWLEQKLLGDADFSAQWLWLHKRWKTQKSDSGRFRIWHRGGHALSENLKFLGLESLPRKLPFFVWASENPLWAICSVAALRALRKGRADALFVGILPDYLRGVFESAQVFEKTFIREGKGGLSAAQIKELYNSYGELEIMFENTKASRAAAKKIGAERVYYFGSAKENKIKGAYFAEPAGAEKCGALARFGAFLKNFGLREEFDFSDIILGGSGAEIVALLCPENADICAIKKALEERLAGANASGKAAILCEFESVRKALQKSFEGGGIEFYSASDLNAAKPAIQNACKISFLKI
ncbi:MAG: hypothetical protein J6P03_06080 [Opitutales bacterium]|nr:hypothetical protein [Opitutales bacterium]